MQQLRYKTKADWLSARKEHRVSATETPKILGYSRFGDSASTVRRKKLGVGKVQNLDNNPHVQFGSRAEWYVFDRAQRDNPGLVLCDPGAFAIQHNPQYPWLQCTVDLFDFHGRSVVELKTGTPNSWRKGPPQEYEWQVRHQMVVTGAEVGLIIALLVPSALKKAWREIPASWAQDAYRRKHGEGSDILDQLEQCELQVHQVEFTEEQRDRLLSETKAFVEDLENWGAGGEDE